MAREKPGGGWIPPPPAEIGLREGLNIGKTSLECIDEVRVFESHLTEHSQTLEFVGVKDVMCEKLQIQKSHTA